MQSYYIQYTSVYPTYASQRPIVVSNNLVKKDFDCSKEGEKDMKKDSKYLRPRWCPTLKRGGCNVCARRNQWSNEWRSSRWDQLP